jgi:hypothetical protein
MLGEVIINSDIGFHTPCFSLDSTSVVQPANHPTLIAIFPPFQGNHVQILFTLNPNIVILCDSVLKSAVRIQVQVISILN